MSFYRYISTQAKQSLEAQLADELALRQGQVVKITHIIDKDWFRSKKVHCQPLLKSEVKQGCLQRGNI